MKVKNVLIKVGGGLGLLIVCLFWTLLELTVAVVGCGLLVLLTGGLVIAKTIRHPKLVWRNRKDLLPAANEFLAVQIACLDVALGGREAVYLTGSEYKYKGEERWIEKQPENS